MSRNHQALLIDELWDETQALNEQIADLQARLAQYEDVAVKVESNSRLTTLKAQACREQDNNWSDWPFCWAVSAFYAVRSRFHSFHETLDEWRLARFNKKERVAFWQEAHPEDISLKML